MALDKHGRSLFIQDLTLRAADRDARNLGLCDGIEVGEAVLVEKGQKGVKRVPISVVGCGRE